MSASGIQHAITLVKQGRLGEAETHLRAALEACPDDARALRLLGTVCHLTNRGDDAASLLHRALEREPRNTSTLLNLGTVHLDAQRFDEARACFERAVAIDPGPADGHFNLGLVAQQAGRLDAAQAHYLAALERDPDALDTAVNLAGVHLRQRNFALCADETASVLTREPAHREARLLHVKALLRLGRLQDAEQAIADADAQLREHPRLRSLEGDLCFRAGRFVEAAAAYRAAMAMGDTRVNTALDLARCLLESGDHGAVIDVLSETAKRSPGVAECHALLGLALYNNAQFEPALGEYETASSLDPERIDYAAMRARVLFELGHDDDATSSVDALIASAPAAISPHLLRVEQRMARNDLPGALAACQSYLQHQGMEWNLLAAKGFLLHALGRGDEAAELMDYERLLSAWTIDPPAGHADLSAFNEALAHHVRTHPSLSHEGAASRATQHGRQSGNLLFGDRGPFEDFAQVLWQAARRYMLSLDADPRHPYLARPPQLDTVHCWGVVLRRSGYQTPHIHPSAWLSGVYYARLPDVVRQTDSQQGWIEFGAPPPELALEPRAPTRSIQPREGLIVLFPSYFYHRTVPCDSDQERISIAFDFSPAKARPSVT